MKKPSISLCMMVRNEEEVLPRCLRSVMHVADEIIVVDTGSADGTVAVAKSLGAKVIQMPWKDNFAAARNRGLEEATGDWIIWLDADEVLDRGEADQLKELLSRDIVLLMYLILFRAHLLNHKFIKYGHIEFNRIDLSNNEFKRAFICKRYNLNSVNFKRNLFFNYGAHLNNFCRVLNIRIEF
ncbi:glycosyltransferase family 2 protein [Paenibacillus sp. P96]|uniref:Glycosyltransferase family 2 protein n=1 Tax=Paenibacillus zeirhizosphaerae TaxID=2987519 RepID=A0ABT9FWL4_9BACL|nr:glycosyltransferase family 2 protein [Paenibacillus sp. P96]MDP4099119.1 glycosyltransferase family 2 protein [Paenibacillus sp. P96]